MRFRSPLSLSRASRLLSPARALPLQAALAAAAIAAVWAYGCGCGARPGSHTDPLHTSRSAASSSDAAAPATSAGPLLESTDPLKARAVLDDPRLAAANTAIAAGDLRAASAALGAAIDQHKPQEIELARWRYLQAQLASKAGDPVAAGPLFDSAASISNWVAAPYAKHAAAKAYASAGKHAEAVERSAAVPEGLPLTNNARLLQAESLEASGQSAAAVELWKAMLRAKRRGPRWAELSVRIAEFLLRDNPDAARAREAAELARAVTLEAPSSNSAAKATQILARATPLLPEAQRSAIEQLSLEERLLQLQALAEGGRRDEAVKTATQILESLEPSQRTGKIACDAAVLKATAASKGGKKAVGADAWADAIQRCEQHKGQLVVALFQGAKQTMAAGRAPEAARLYGRVEAEFASHSYADDARLRGARLARLMNDESRFQQMLLQMPKDYPDGDMLEDGQFELALPLMGQQNWAGALSALERSLALRPVEKPYLVAGRARYFAARMQGLLGRTQAELTGLQQVVRDYPFSYYMVQAWSRLASLNAKAARDLLQARQAQEEPGTLWGGATPELQTPAFNRALELLRLGESALAREEILALGLTAEANGPALWTIASLYARLGATDLAFRFARSRSNDWSPHYAAGRWRAPWEYAYPRAFAPIVDREAAKAGLPISVAYGIMREESMFEPDAVSSANAYGLMQLIVPTAKSVAEPLGLPHDPDALRRPEINITLGCRLLASLRRSFGATPVLAIPSYNAGSGATRKWLAGRGPQDFDLWVEQIPYEETRNYTKRVISSVAVYASLYEPDHFEEIAKLPLQVRE